MARQNLQEQLGKLEQKQRALEAEIRHKKAALAEQKRKADTRRKIILGGLVEKHCELNPASGFAREVKRLVSEWVSGDNERALFGLPPLPAGKREPAAAAGNHDAQSRNASSLESE